MGSANFKRLWRKGWPRPGFLKRYLHGLDSNIVQRPTVLDVFYK